MKAFFKKLLLIFLPFIIIIIIMTHLNTVISDHIVE